MGQALWLPLPTPGAITCHGLPRAGRAIGFLTAPRVAENPQADLLIYTLRLGEGTWVPSPQAPAGTQLVAALGTSDLTCLLSPFQGWTESLPLVGAGAEGSPGGGVASGASSSLAAPGRAKGAACQPGRRKLRAWGRQPSPASLLGSGTAQPLPRCTASSLCSRLLAFLACRSFPGHPGKELRRAGRWPRLL